MPERILVVKWPNNQEQKIYSPSSIIASYFDVGDKLEKNDFVDKSIEALQHAGNRVEEKYGYVCTSAISSIHQIKRMADESTNQEGQVEILAIQS